MSQKMRTIIVATGVTLLFVSSTWGMYCPQTGRFLQRDPLGVDPSGQAANPFDALGQYEEGSVLYEYVQSSPVSLGDPSGLAIADGPCEAAIRAALNTNKAKKLLADLTKKRNRGGPGAKQPRCAIPIFRCLCCGRTQPPRGGAGAFLPWRYEVYVCRERLNAVAQVEQVVIHELIHAWDDCKKKTDWSDCYERACSEIRAAFNSGQCDPGGFWIRPGETKDSCVRRNACKSVRRVSQCLPASIYVNAKFLECSADRKPL